MDNSVSVIITFFNEKSLIRRAVASVIKNLEVYRGCEIILCNDGPLLATEILRELPSIPSSIDFKIVTNNHERGPGGNRNTGISEAKNNFIAFLDADDFWKTGKITAQLELCKKGHNFIATAYEFEDSATLVQPPRNIIRPIDIFKKRGLGTSTVLVTRELIDNARFANFRFAQDIDFWYKLALNNNFSFAALSEAYTVYNIGGSTKNKIMQFKYFNRVLQNNKISLIARGQILMSYSLTGFLNHYVRR